MLKREESIELPSDTDSSSDLDNPFNEYVQKFKNSIKTQASIQPTLPNTTIASNLSTPLHNEAIEIEKGPQSEINQTESKQEENLPTKQREFSSDDQTLTLL